MANQYPTCGFVPPYILEAVAKSTGVKESRHACERTLKHAETTAQYRHEECIKAYIEQANADCHEAHVQRQHKNQQTFGIKQHSAGGLVERQIYDCKGTEELPGTLVRSEGGDRTRDRQVNNTYDGFGIVRDFFQGTLSCEAVLEVFGRNSLDNDGLTLMGSVHYTPSDSPAGYNNAYWNGNSNQMVFGDGDHIAFDYLTDSLDVIGHELGHGFVQYSSPLEYQNQSGALNESCADIFGSMTEQWHTHQTVDDADWNLGQTLFPIAFTGSCLRTLKAGKAYADDPVFGTDPQPKHMRDLYTGDGDGGGVHINSGIPNHAFYLAAKALGGYSWEKAGKVWYKTMTSSGRIPVDCDFETFAKVTVDVAGDGEFEGTEVREAIRGAWEQVGVLVPEAK